MCNPTAPTPGSPTPSPSPRPPAAGLDALDQTFPCKFLSDCRALCIPGETTRESDLGTEELLHPRLLFSETRLEDVRRAGLPCPTSWAPLPVLHTAHPPPLPLRAGPGLVPRGMARSPGNSLWAFLQGHWAAGLLIRHGEKEVQKASLSGLLESRSSFVRSRAPS